ncbi:hypothetical protein LCGC14_1993500 [marine sediment metagenome]|uniref:Uncharacterized protein n=1 Tax=marine sediment metagenome TaxID=412755 RepID=A0A0F9I2I9_9ZZZZ
MADAKNRGLMRLANRILINLNAVAPSEMSLYQVPLNKEALPVMVILRELSADAANAVVTFGLYGVAGNVDQWLSDVTLSGFDAVDKGGVIMPIPAATPVVQDLLTAGQEFGVEITTAAGGACTCTMDTFGYEWDV